MSPGLPGQGGGFLRDAAPPEGYIRQVDNLHLDPSVIGFMAYLAWRPPSVVREAALLPHAVEAFRASQLSQIEEVERQLEHWIATGRVKRERFWHLIAGKQVSSGSLEYLSNLIGDIERSCMDQAGDVARLRRALQDDQQRAASLSQAAAVALQETDDRLVAARERELQEYMDFALFLRACRAEIDSKARNGTTFDDPADLEAHLLSAVRP